MRAWIAPLLSLAGLAACAQPIGNALYAEDRLTRIHDELLAYYPSRRSPSQLGALRDFAARFPDFCRSDETMVACTIARPVTLTVAGEEEPGWRIVGAMETTNGLRCGLEGQGPDAKPDAYIPELAFLNLDISPPGWTTQSDTTRIMIPAETKRIRHLAEVGHFVDGCG
ncbi:hypothetical protein ACMA5I_13325 [Paracoccaceae bacterium GXU_MW_L88]